MLYFRSMTRTKTLLGRDIAGTCFSGRIRWIILATVLRSRWKRWMMERWFHAISGGDITWSPIFVLKMSHNSLATKFSIYWYYNLKKIDEFYDQIVSRFFFKSRIFYYLIGEGCSSFQRYFPAGKNPFGSSVFIRFACFSILEICFYLKFYYYCFFSLLFIVWCEVVNFSWCCKINHFMFTPFLFQIGSCMCI